MSGSILPKLAKIQNIGFRQDADALEDDMVLIADVGLT